MSRSKKSKHKDSLWNPEYGFCKGLANHCWSRKETLLAIKGMWTTVELHCTQCTTSRIDVIASTGRVVRRSYQYAKGYLQSDNKKRIPKATIRKEFVQYLRKTSK